MLLVFKTQILYDLALSGGAFGRTEPGAGRGLFELLRNGARPKHAKLAKPYVDDITP